MMCNIENHLFAYITCFIVGMLVAFAMAEYGVYRRFKDKE